MHCLMKPGRRKSSMNHKAILSKMFTAAIALTAGYFGAAIRGWTNQNHDIVRAKRFEVINSSGNILSYWGPDSDPHIARSTPKGILLVFMDPKGTRRCQIGSQI